MSEWYMWIKTTHLNWKCTIIALFVWTSALQDTLASIGYPLVRNISPSEYGAGIQNYEIHQDFRGLIYIANNFGLLEYDGNMWRTFSAPNGTKVRSLSIAENGRIYIGCQNDFGYFFPDKRGIYQYTSLADSLPDSLRNLDEVWKVFNDGKNVFFSTFDRVFIYKKDQLEIIETENPIDYTFFTQGRFFLLEENKGLHEYVDDKLRFIEPSGIFADRIIADIIPFDNQNQLIVTFNNGCYLYDGIRFKKWEYEVENAVNEATAGCALRLLDGRIVIGTQNKGLYILERDGSLSLHMSKDEGLINRTILSLFQDHAGNLWAGSNNGLSILEISSPFSMINETMNLPGTGYAAYINQKKLYLGTNNGLYNANLPFKNEGKNTMVQNKGLSGQIYSIQETKDQVLIGHHEGAYYLDDNQPVKFGKPTGAWTFLQLRQNPDVLIGGTYKGLIQYKWNGANWAYNKKLRGFDESSRIMEQDEQGNIWMAHGYKGLYKIRLNKQLDSIVDVRYYNQQDGLPSNVLLGVFRIQNQLVFTSQSGIYQYDKAADRFEPHPFYNQYFGSTPTVMDLEEDAVGNIYAIVNNNLKMLKKNGQGNYKVIDNTFNRINDMFNDDLMNVTALGDNHILIGAKEGFVYFNSKDITDRTIPFYLNMRKIELISGKDSLIFQGNFTHKGTVTDIKNGNNSLTLPYKYNSIRFTFASTFFEGAQPVQYQYYLKHFEEHWSPWTTKNEKEYTNLPEGNYTFLVRAKNLYGSLSDPIEYRLRIDPPWHRTTLAYTLYLIFAISLIGISMVVVDYKHRKARKHLLSKQKKELSRKDTELENITKQSEATITQLKNDKLTAEVRHKNNELANSTMHLIHKNEFIVDIKSRLNNVVKKEKNREVKAILNRMVKDIDQNINHDKDWEHFQYHFDRVHGDFMKRITSQYPDLTAQEIKLCAYLRLNLSTKEIAQLLHISVRGVEVGRYRLRKKLNLPREINLAKFILEF